LQLPEYLVKSKLIYVCITDLEGRYIYVNDSFNECYSFLRADFIGLDSLETVHESDRDVVSQAAMKCLQNPGESVPCFVRKPASESTKLWHLTNWELSAYFDEEGNLAGVMCIGNEVTLNDKHFDLLQVHPDSLIVLNANAEVIDFNFKEKHPLWQFKDSILSKNYFEFYPEDFRVEVRREFSTCLKEAVEGSFEYSIKNAQDGITYLKCYLSNISFNGSPHVLLLERDVTEEVKKSKLLIESSNRIENIWESMTDLFHVINKEGQIEYANSSWEEFFGIKGKDYIGKNIWELFPDSVNSQFYKAYNDAINNQKSVHFVEYYAPRDEWYDLNIYPNQRGVTVYTRNVTVTKKLEIKEKELKEQLNSVWDKLIDGYIKLNKNLEFTYTNNAWNALFGFKQNEVLGKAFIEVFPELLNDEILSLIELVGKTKEVKRHLSFFKKQELWINSAILPDGDGYNIFMQDASSQEKMKNAMSDLSFMTSHELRHEYAKLHSVINLLSVTKEDDQYLLKEANKSLIQINSLISVMNDKLTFNRDNSIRGNGNDYNEFDEVILIDDDHVINFINARVVRLLFKEAKVKSFIQGEKALDYLKQNDTSGNKLIFIDLNMPGFDGWDFLEAYSKFMVRSPVYVLTSSINPKDIERSLNYNEVVKFLTKPLSEEMLEAERIKPVGLSKQNL
jgi:PAS domain S-box-containing protein